jgi:HK97 gp10 family phage protein
VTEVNVQGLDGLLERLKALPKEISGKAGGPVKKSLVAGAKLIADESKMTLQAAINRPNVDGVISRATGFLKSSIQVKRATNPPRGIAEKVSVRVKRGKTADGTSVTKYGKALEFGTVKQTATPWLRPAFETKKEAALNVIVSALRDAVAKAEKKVNKLK